MAQDSTTYAALLHAVHDLHDVQHPQDFPSAVLEVVPRVVPSEITAYNEIDPVAQQVVAVVDPPDAIFEGAEQVLARHAADHPLISRAARTGDGSAYKISDFLTPSEWRASAIYRELYVLLGVEHQLACSLPTVLPRVIGVALNRGPGSADFSEDDRTALNLLRPHLVQAWLRVRERDRLRVLLATSTEALEQSGAYVLLLEEPPTELTPGAFDLLERYFGPPPAPRALPEPVQRWLDADASALDAVPRPPASADRDGRRLLLRRLAGGTTPPALLLTERTVVPSLPELQSLGLSAQESEVLRRLSGGLSNADIAAQLHLAPGTVKKHLDNVYRKLGVSGRGEAVWMALDLLQGASTPLGVATPDSLAASLHPRLD